MKRLAILLLVPVVALGATIKNDTFTDTDTTNLKSHTSDSGGSWQGASSTVQISSNAAVETAGATNGLIGDEAPTETDYYVQGTCTLNDTASTTRCGVVARADGTTTFDPTTSSYYLARTNGSAGDITWNGFRFNTGSGSVPTGCTLSGTLTGIDNNDPVKMKIQVEGVGATVTVTVSYDADIDGGGFSGSFTTLETCSDSDAGRITTAGNVGVYLRGTAAVMDDFIAEDLTAGGSVPVIMEHYRRRRQ